MGLFKRVGKGVAAAGSARGNWRTWRRRSCLLIAAVVLLPGPMFIGGVALQIYEFQVQRDIDALEASIRAKGEPVTLEELEAYYPKVPDAENGALVYLKAMEVLKAIDDEDAESYELYSQGDRLKENKHTLETLAEVRVRLVAREPVFTLLADALNYSLFYYPLDLGLSRFGGSADISTRYGNRVGELLWIRGFIAVQDRDWAAYSKSQRGLVHFAESTGAIPGWRSINGLGIRAYARELAKLAIATGEVSDLLGSELQQLFLRIDPAASAHLYNIGLRCLNLALLDVYMQGEKSYSGIRVPIRARWMRLWWVPGSRCVALLERRRILRFTTAILDDDGKPLRVRFTNSIARQPYFENWNYELKRRTYNADGTWLQEEMTLADIIKSWFKPELCVSQSSMFFTYFDLTNHVVYEETLQHCLRMALLINSYRQKTVGFPASAEALGPDVVADPYDGAPLRFKPVEGGFIVYSVGDDLIDHGGVMRSDEGSDIVVEFIRDTRVVPEKDPPRETGRAGPLGGGRRGARGVSGG